MPVDGQIVLGQTSVDQSIITGESLPTEKKIGDMVFCGTINRFGSIDIMAMQVGKDSSLQKMIDLVKEAENKKAPMQRIVDKWASWLVPIALLIAVVTYLVTFEIVKAVTILVVFCPCALALATPTSIIAAIGQATKHGIMIKSGEALEKMGGIDCIAFDKTGTITFGKPHVSDVVVFREGMHDSDFLSVVASVEARSEHPLGKAIVDHAKRKNIVLSEVSNYEMLPGLGVKAVVDSKEILCGNDRFLFDNGIVFSDKVQINLETFREEGKASIIVSSDDEILGIIALSDTPRPNARIAVQKLEKTGLQLLLLSGDNKTTASYIARKVGIKNVHAELLPRDKAKMIKDLMESGKRVAMVGDGVNDALALKTADVGIAMGGIGSDISIEAADITLISDDITTIPYLRNLSRSTVRTIKGNIAASMAINFVAITMSILGLLNPITGALVHNAGSVLVVLNAALLYDRKFQ